MPCFHAELMAAEKQTLAVFRSTQISDTTTCPACEIWLRLFEATLAPRLRRPTSLRERRLLDCTNPGRGRLRLWSRANSAFAGRQAKHDHSFGDCEAPGGFANTQLVPSATRPCSSRCEGGEEIGGPGCGTVSQFASLIQSARTPRRSDYGVLRQRPH